MTVYDLRSLFFMTCEHEVELALYDKRGTPIDDNMPFMWQQGQTVIEIRNWGIKCVPYEKSIGNPERTYIMPNKAVLILDVVVDVD